MDAQTIYTLLTSKFPYIDLSVTDKERWGYIELLLWKRVKLVL